MDNLSDLRKKYGQFFEKMKLPFDDYFLTLDIYNQGSLIKKNKMSSIYKITSKEENINYAAKITNLNITKFSKFEKTNIPNSLYIMSKLSHPTILKLIGISPFDFKNKQKAVIITEICSNGSLYDLLNIESQCPNQNSEWNSTTKLINIFGIAAGMQHIHSCNIVHQNLNPRSILLDDKMHPKINGFEYSKDLSKNDNIIDAQNVGDPFYIVPEIFTQKDYSQANDISSFGLIVYEILTNNKLLKDVDSFNPKIMESIPISYRNLIESCLQKDQN